MSERETPTGQPADLARAAQLRDQVTYLVQQLRNARPIVRQLDQETLQRLQLEAGSFAEYVSIARNVARQVAR